MRSIESLVELFGQIPPADGDRWSVESVVSTRLHVSRGPTGAFALFVEGELQSFGELPAWAGVEHSSRITVLPSGRAISAVRIGSRDPIHGNRAIAHIGYELGRRLEARPDIGNAELVEGITWILPLLGDPERILTQERQYGLVGECILLHRLLSIAATLGKPGRDALMKWKGAGLARRDFAGQGIAVEVKTTGQNARIHHIASLDKLEPHAPDEAVFLFSVGLHMDTSAPKKLPDYINDIEASLLDNAGRPDEQAILIFCEGLKGYGYDKAQTGLYRSQPGFAPPHLSPALYPEESLDRLRLSSFREDRLPSMVIGVGYTLEVQGPGLSPERERSVLERLVRAPSIG
jgi:hypothetical protein